MDLNIPDWEPEVECEVGAEWPTDHDWEALARVAMRLAHNVAPELSNPSLCVSVVFGSDDDVRALNLEWRSKDEPTNVLSFPMLERDDLLALATGGPPVLLGDIALAFETCQQEAIAKGIFLGDHTIHLIVHGLLHLAGYDHETSPADACAMETLEIKALALMGIADPYGDHEQG